MNRIVLAHIAAFAAAVSAGTAVVATRFVVGETDPLSLVFYRYVISVACFAPFLKVIWPREPLSLADCARIAGFGILFFVLFPWAFNASLQYVPAARGAIGLATIPIQTMIVAFIFGRERFTAAKVFGVGMAFAGIVLAFGTASFQPGHSGYLLGDGLMLLGVFCAAVYSVFSRATLMRFGPLFVTALAMVFAVLALLPVVVLTHGPVLPVFSTRGWLAVLFLGTVAGAVQFSLFMWALRWLPPTTTVLYLTLNPVAAMVLGILLLGERLTPEMLAGFALVLTGILVGVGVLRVPKGNGPRRGPVPMRRYPLVRPSRPTPPWSAPTRRSPTA